MTPRVLVEYAFQLVSSLLNVLLPLRLEEVKAFGCNNVGVLLCEVFDSSDTLVESGILDLSCNSNFYRVSGSSGLGHL